MIAQHLMHRGVEGTRQAMDGADGRIAFIAFDLGDDRLGNA
jgi:hypothetical protein